VRADRRGRTWKVFVLAAVVLVAPLVVTTPAHAAEGTFSLTAASAPTSVASGDGAVVSLSYLCAGAPGDVCTDAYVDLPWNTPNDVFGLPLPALDVAPVGSPPDVAGIEKVGATVRVRFTSPLPAGAAGNVLIRHTTHHVSTPGGTAYTATPLAVSAGGSVSFGSAIGFTVTTPNRDAAWDLSWNPGDPLVLRDLPRMVSVGVCPPDFVGYEYLPPTFVDLTIADDRVEVLQAPGPDAEVLSTSPSLVIRYRPQAFFTGCWNDRITQQLVVRFPSATFSAGEVIPYQVTVSAGGNQVVPSPITGSWEIAPDSLTAVQGAAWSQPSRHPGGSASVATDINVLGNALVREVTGTITLPPPGEFEPERFGAGDFTGWLGPTSSLTVRFLDGAMNELGTATVPPNDTVPVPPGTIHIEFRFEAGPGTRPSFSLGPVVFGRIAPTAVPGTTVTATFTATVTGVESDPPPVEVSASAGILVSDPIPQPGVEVRSPTLGGGPVPPGTGGEVVVEVRNTGAAPYPAAHLTLRWSPSVLQVDGNALTVDFPITHTVLEDAPGVLRIRFDDPIPADTSFEVRVPAVMLPFSYLDHSQRVTATLSSADDATDLVLNPLIDPCDGGERVDDHTDDDGDGRTDGDHACRNEMPLRTVRSVLLGIEHGNRKHDTDDWGTEVRFDGPADTAEVLLRWRNRSSVPVRIGTIVWTLPAVGDHRPDRPGTGRGSEFGVLLAGIPEMWGSDDRQPPPPLSVSDAIDPCPDGTPASCDVTDWVEPYEMPLEQVRSIRINATASVPPGYELVVTVPVTADPATLASASGAGGGPSAAVVRTAYSDWVTWSAATDTPEGEPVTGAASTIRFLIEATAPDDPDEPGDPDGPGDPGDPGRPDPVSETGLTPAVPTSAGPAGPLAYTGASLLGALSAVGLTLLATGARLGRRRWRPVADHPGG